MALKKKSIFGSSGLQPVHLLFKFRASFLNFKAWMWIPLIGFGAKLDTYTYLINVFLLIACPGQQK